MKKKFIGNGISHASFWYLTNGAQLLLFFSCLVRFWFKIFLQIVLASFVLGLLVKKTNSKLATSSLW